MLTVDGEGGFDKLRNNTKGKPRGRTFDGDIHQHLLTIEAINVKFIDGAVSTTFRFNFSAFSFSAGGGSKN